MPQVEFLIVGQGLAGTCLALEFLKRGRKFILIDKPNPNSASRVAAGLFNPITGKTNQSTWRAVEIFRELKDFYRNAESNTGQQFLFPMPIYRPFLSHQEQIKWPSENNEWVSHVWRESRYPDLVNDTFGGIEIQGSGYLNTATFLAAVRTLVSDSGSLIESRFECSAMVAGSKVFYENIEADKIIFCEGVGSLANPWFNWAPIRKLKGELLKAHVKLPNDSIINRGVFAVPTGMSGQFIIGSTYFHDPAPGVTKAGIEELTTRAKALFKSEIEVMDKNWGHRPTTPDRRPILGYHPTHKNVCIFNGLGTKGVSLAPFFAVHFANWLEGKVELHKEVNIERFYSLSLKVSGE